MLTLASGAYNRLEFSQFKLLHEDMLALIIIIDDINSVNKLGDSALHIACKHGLTSIALKLLERGADLNLKNKLRHTPIDCAILQCETQLLFALKQAGYISEPIQGNHYTLLPPQRQLK